MKASEVLKRYNNGRRDFSGECLRVQSFKGKNLAGADFSEADIRGANFTNAYLRGAKFCSAKAGLRLQEAIFWLAILFLLTFLGGLSPVSALGVLSVQLTNIVFEQNALLLSVVVLGLLLSFVFIWVSKGISAGLGGLILIMFVAGIVAGIGNTVALWTDKAVVNWVTGIGGALAIAVTISGLIACTVVLAGTVAERTIGVGLFAGALVSGVTGAVIRVASRSGIDDVQQSFATLNWNWASIDLVWGWTFAWGVSLVGGYLGWRTLTGDENFSWLRKIAIVFAATGGTSFRGADLTDADFTAARLKSTDFRKAILTRTRWRDANKLDRARPGTSYLSSVTVRELVRTLQGQDKNFDQLPLRGVNLRGANLADASFIGTDLNEANLQDTDLSRAKLVQTQLDEANLKGANLTGATIEDWGITSHTQLHGIRCQYVFMRLPTKNDPNPRRKPDNWDEEFEDGDFADFIKPIVDTLDLYHNQGVDPRAIAISFKQLAENNPDAGLEIVAMGKRGKDKFLLRAATASSADHSQLNAEYFTTYNQIKALAEVEVKALLTEKDSRISSLENMVQTALQRPSFYAQNYNHKGDTMPDKSSEINISNVTGSKISGVAGGESTAVAGENLTGVAGGDISGTVTNTINQLTESESPEAPTLADLLKQLKTAIESQDSGLSEKERKKALKHLDTIGKLGVEPNNSNLQEMAENALDALPTILKRGAGLIGFIKTHFNLELDEILDNIQGILNF